jgi:uncharacterized protein involved in type VI secretion and phage assembly
MLLCRNDVAFNNKPITSYVETIFRGTYWLRFWRLLQEETEREVIMQAYHAMEVVAMELFAKN